MLSIVFILCISLSVFFLFYILELHFQNLNLKSLQLGAAHASSLYSH